LEQDARKNNFYVLRIPNSPCNTVQHISSLCVSNHLDPFSLCDRAATCDGRTDAKHIALYVFPSRGKGRIPRYRHPREDPREEIARVGRKNVGVSGESVSVSWNAALTKLSPTYNNFSNRLNQRQFRLEHNIKLEVCKLVKFPLSK